MNKAIALLLAASQMAFVDAAVSQTGAPEYDIIIRGGTVFDGTGRPGRKADVGIVGDAIATVGDLSGASAGRDVDASGKYVTPGFINLHSHASRTAAAAADNMLYQGVTTDLINADGGMAPPVTNVRAGVQSFTKDGLGYNLGPYVGFNGVWANVVGNTDRRPTAAEIDTMQKLVVRALEEGAWGVSAGLDYKPAYFARTSEVIDVVKAAAPWRTNFTNHDRVAPPGWSSLEGMSETLTIGREAGLIPVVTHMKLWAKEGGRSAEALDLLRKSTATGHYAVADAYPYTIALSGPTGLLIPGWVVDGGRTAMLTRFKDPALRTQIVTETESALVARIGRPENLYFTKQRKWLPELMAEMNAGPGETIVRLLEQAEQRAIFRFGRESDVEAILSYPDTAMACDCGATTERAHPRAYGSFARTLGLYTRERGVLTWPDVIRKLTLLPASTVGMIDRGMIAPGMVADIAVFDPNTVTDRATIEDPVILATGFSDVLVAGQPALAGGVRTGSRTGRVLLRGPDMPSRPMRLAKEGQLSACAKVRDGASDAAARVCFKLTIDGSGVPGGSMTIKRNGGVTLTAVRFGPMQTADGWASFAGWTTGEGRGAPVIVTLDRRMPGATSAAPVVTVREGGNTLRGMLSARAVRSVL